ncbi:MAG: hypothetical protein COV34_03565 [Candidatus Zambryskibacteria bacterium CG10_big_fil_rev_8_21_14_0_10_42_12]|uniref:TraC-like domain-containing protein n=1 Tax=Candidatus Zambryskibacteria bacterium CG10_big_fil_rev_8_21_14_0_10_42_12 TaxID=1975115 RepID=A0A2H0QSP8_9BACT|nr:MAG: hypothetical protein COV34_03565 [Candidatus Zambryskibacteria bacterium CG10_big_fil_rev_8_21_14_0_10_42_12]
MAINANATQQFVPIEDVVNGVVKLKDGSLRAIIIASSLNFALKSEDERQAIIMQFQDFLNSLDFSVQIYVQSRRLDIQPYLTLLEAQYKQQINDLLKIQIREYIDFVKSFTEATNIMTKSFFIVVPYTPALIGSGDGIFGLLNRKAKQTPEAEAANAFEEHRAQLEQRVSVVEQGLVRSGVRVARLGTDEVIELYYKIFNPGETEKPIPLT